jgi:hypothetical protein
MKDGGKVSWAMLRCHIIMAKLVIPELKAIILPCSLWMSSLAI